MTHICFKRKRKTTDYAITKINSCVTRDSRVFCCNAEHRNKANDRINCDLKEDDP